MKNWTKLFGIIALIAVLGFSIVSCKEPEESEPGPDGRTRENAIPLTTNDFGGSIPVGGEQWFSYTATKTEIKFLITWGTLQSAHVQAHDSAGTPLGNGISLSGNTRIGTFTGAVVGNLYYIKIRAVNSSDSGTFQVKLYN
jgi:hypothetical protein